MDSIGGGRSNDDDGTGGGSLYFGGGGDFTDSDDGSEFNVNGNSGDRYRKNKNLYAGGMMDKNI